MTQGTVVLLSGGLDSATLLADTQLTPIHTLSIFYGQRHLRELTAAAKIAEHYKVPNIQLTIPESVTKPLFKGSSQTDLNIPVPEGHYEDESMRITVVPNRNMILLSLATAYAYSNGLRYVAYAAHAGDHFIYPDCRLDFVDAMSYAINRITDPGGEHVLITPYIQKTKAQIVERGLQLNVPYELTWTCYKGLQVPCGVCGSCVERAEAFRLNGVEDPLLNGRR